MPGLSRIGPAWVPERQVHALMAEQPINEIRALRLAIAADQGEITRLTAEIGRKLAAVVVLQQSLRNGLALVVSRKEVIQFRDESANKSRSR